jgi:ankyrin repeat protein
VTPLYIAAEKGYTDIFQILAEKLPLEELNKPTKYGVTPLYIAAERGRTDIVRILAENLPPEELNKPRNDGVTPAIIAAHNQAIDALLELAKHGASPYASYRGVDVFSYAIKGGCDLEKIPEIAQAYEDFKRGQESINKKNPRPIAKQAGAAKVAIDPEIKLEL